MKPKRNMTRRRFLIGATGVSVVTCGGLMAWGVNEPTIEFIETSYGDPAQANTKILVAYTSNFGSTGGIADAMAQEFYQNGSYAEVRRIEHIDDVTPFDAVVIGSPLISDEWKPEAVNFVKKHQDTLAQIPVAYFLACMTLALAPNGDKQAEVANALGKVRDEIPAVVPAEMGLFAGAVDYSKMSALRAIVYRLFSPDDTAGDFRDWDAIHSWARELYSRLVVV